MRVAVLGATGEMGGRVCRLLRRWVPGVQLVGANRSGTGHRDFPVQRVDRSDAAGLRELLRDVDLLVNAVGPYRYDPAVLIEASVASHCHYVDLAEDLAFLVRVERLARACGARQAGVCLVPGCSTMPGLVQLLASRWSGQAPVARVEVWLSLGSANPLSRGLATGLLGPLGQPRPDGRRWFSRLEALRSRDGRVRRYGGYPAAFPSRGLRLGARRVPVTFHVGFDRAWLGRGLVLAGRLLGRLPAGAPQGAARLLVPLARLLRPFGTREGLLTLVARDGQGAELERTELRARARGLDLPAAPVVWVVQALAAGSLPAGVVGLDRVVTRSHARSWLREAGYELREGSGP